MRFIQASIISVAAFSLSIDALTITSPSENAVINPQQTFTVRWTSDPGDPQIISLDVAGAGDFSIAQYKEIASNVQTSAGSVEVPPNTLTTWGQVKVNARDTSGSIISSSSPFSLAQGNGATTSISSNQDVTGTIILPTESVSDSMTAGNPQISTVTDANGTSIVISGTVEPTSSTRAPTTSTSQASQSSPTPTSTPNAQVRLGGDGKAMVLTMAGALAGLVALVA